MLRRLLFCIALIAMAVPAAAVAHVTLQPGEWEPGAFATVVVRVPNERDDAETTTVTVQFPETIPEARFKPHPTCEREVQREELAEPIEDLTERIVSVTWTCDPAIPDRRVRRVRDQLPACPRTPQPGDEILFPAVQTYSSGEEVGWVDPDPEADTPAPRLVVVEPEEEEAAAAPAPTTTEAVDETTAAPAVGTDDDDDDSLATVAIIFGIAGLVAGLAALGVALFRKPGSAS